MAGIRVFAPALRLALIGVICLIGMGPTLLAAQDRGIRLAAGDVSEKEAFEAAKELGTIEAWEAFLTNFSTGFRADLARAYVNQLGLEKPEAAQAKPAEPVPAAAPQSPADLSVAITPNQASCSGGAPCSYTVVATNVGGKPFARQSVIAVGLTPGASRLVSSPGPWSCQAMAGGAVCFNPNPNLGPGQSATIPITFGLRRGGTGSLRSCAQISWGGAPTSSSVRDVQQALNGRGFNAGPADGQAGRKTVQAIRNFQSQNGLPATGEVDLALLFNLFTQQQPGDANPGNDRACIQTTLQGAPAAAYTPPAAKPRTKPTRKRGCPSGTVFLEGQCVKRSQVAAFCGPGYKRSGSKCVSRYPAASGQAPAPPRQAQPNPSATIGGVAAQIINQVNQQRQCSGGRVRINGKCKCPRRADVFRARPCVQKPGPATNRPAGTGRARGPSRAERTARPAATPADYQEEMPRRSGAQP